MMWASLKGAHMDVQEVADRLEIQELLAKYARGVDRKQFELWKDVFTADAVLDYSNVGHAPGPRDEVIAYFAAALAHVPMTQHFVSNVECEFEADGDSAKVLRRLLPPPVRAHRRRVAQRARGGGERVVRQSPAGTRGVTHPAGT